MLKNNIIKPVLQQNVKSAYDFIEVIKYFDKKFDIDLDIIGGEKSFWHWMLGEIEINKGMNFTLDIKRCSGIPEFAQKIIDILSKEGFDDEEKDVFVFYHGD